MLLMRMEENPDMWTQAGTILEQSQSQHTRFIGLQVRSVQLVDLPSLPRMICCTHITWVNVIYL